MSGDGAVFSIDSISNEFVKAMSMEDVVEGQCIEQRCGRRYRQINFSKFGD